MQALLVLLKLLLLVGGKNAYRYGAKIAANNHLLVWYKSTASSLHTSLQYQCTAHIDKLHSTLFNLTSICSISIGKLQNETQLYFIVAGMVNYIHYMSKIKVNCDNNRAEIETVFYNQLKYSINHDDFVVTVDPMVALQLDVQFSLHYSTIWLV